MIYSILTFTLAFVALTYLYFIAKRDVFVNPVFYFVAFQLINLFGTLPFLDYSNDADRVYFYINVTAIFCGLLGFVLGDYFFPVGLKTIKEWNYLPIRAESGIVYSKLIYCLILISTVICLLYYIAVGYNVFLMSIMSYATGGGIVKDVSALRMASYNSEITGNYYYPGYVNQFKDTLLPLSVIYLWVFRNMVPIKFSKISNYILYVISFLALIFILGTGQRGAFIFASVMGAAFILTVVDPKKKKKFVVLGALAGLGFMMLSTFLIGRSGTSSFELWPTLEAIFWRISSANQWGSTIGFREVIYVEPIQWGGEWKKSLFGLLPGVEGSMLSNRIARRIWGGFGTAPPSNWGSTYHNFGWFGIVLIPLIFSVILKYFYQRFYSRRKQLFRVMIYTACFVLIGTWIAGNPINYFFNVGLIAIIFLRLFLKKLTTLFGARSIIVSQSHLNG